MPFFRLIIGLRQRNWDTNRLMCMAQTIKTDSTFQLVKSLTRNEKRYFKLYSGITKGSKNYMRIFDLMERQKEYDEALLKRKLSGAAFAEQLTYEKYYLRKMILKALRAYHAANDNRFGNTISDLEILTEKAIPELFLPMVKKAKLEALLKDTLAEYILLSRYELRFAGNMQMTDWFISHMDDGFTAEMQLIDNYKHALFILAKYNELNLIEAKYRFTDKRAFQERIRKITDDVLFEGLLDKLPLKAQITYFNFFSQYYAVQYRFEESYAVTREQMTFIESKQLTPKQIGLFNYPVMIMRNIESSRRLEKYDESLTWCVKLLEVINGTEYHQAKALKDQFMVVYLDAMMNNYSLAAEYHKCLQFYDDHLEAFKQLDSIGGVNLQIAIHFYKACSYFGLKEYRLVLDELYLLFALEKATPFAYQIYPARVIYLLTHLELGDITYCVNYLRSFKRYFDKIQTDHNTINFITKLVKTYIKISYSKKLFAKKYPDWIVQIAQISQDNFEKEFLLNCQLEKWLYQKYHNVSPNHL